MRTKYTGIDQAEGLRRLLVRNQTQIITVVAARAGIGRTSVVVNCAAALAKAGKDVLLLDENRSARNVLQLLSLKPHFDLLDVALGRCAANDALLTSNGVSVLSSSRAMSYLSKFRADELQRLEQALTQLSNGMDVMLVDAAMLIDQAVVSSSLASNATLVLVVDVSTQGITESYALIKRLALHNARSNFEIVINNAHDAKTAQMVFDNMATVAQRNLGARLSYLGYIPHDEQLKRAVQLGRSVVEAFPTALSSQRFLELSERLLRLPVLHDETEGGISHMMQNLMRQLRRGEFTVN